jgi:hypothetical protein
MNDSVVISVENLGKKYRIQHQAERQRYVALRDVIAEKAKGVFQMLKSGDKTESRKQKAEISPDKSESRKQKSENKNDFSFPISAFSFEGGMWLN